MFTSFPMRELFARLCDQGASGGGKSSIVKLVERFYVPASGQVLLDDRDVGVYDPKWLKRRVGLVGQEPVLYARCDPLRCFYVEPA